MTLNDFLKRVDLEQDKDKMLIYRDGKGWTNIEIEVKDLEISITGGKNSPFSSDN